MVEVTQGLAIASEAIFVGLGFQSLKYQPSTGLHVRGRKKSNSEFSVPQSLHTLDGDFSILRRLCLLGYREDCMSGFRGFRFHTMKGSDFLFQGDCFSRWQSLVNYRLRSIHSFPAAALREVSDPAPLSPVTFKI